MTNEELYWENYQAGFDKYAAWIDKFKNSVNLANDEDMLRISLHQQPVRALFSFAPLSQKKNTIKNLRSRYAGGIAGTYTKDKVFLNRKFYKPNDPLNRETIAHELFHTKTPILGNSEILAHIYGKYKAVKNKNPLTILESTASGIKHLVTTRPDRAAIEAGLLASTGYGGYKLIKALRKNKSKKNRILNLLNKIKEKLV
jgi:hypothetical protein